MEEQRSIQVKLTRVDGATAYFTSDRGHAIAWPRERLPETCHPGDAFCLKLTSPQDEDRERNKLALAMLNEILKTQ
jgi:hypothetical protein